MNADFVMALYDAEVSAGRLTPDHAQRAAAAGLDQLKAALEQRQKWRIIPFWPAPQAPALRGLYLYGGVGRGKTMLMDLFYGVVQVAPKRRCHFHEFMAEVHERLAVARVKAEGDPVTHVSAAIARSATLLCFDELHVSDIADAMILGRLFKGLYEARVTIVATSNALPADLYAGGLNRQLFLPFIDLIEEHMHVLQLDAARDYRLDKLAGHPLYYAPLTRAARGKLDMHWRHLTGGVDVARTLKVKGRTLDVRRSGPGVARFTFAELCERPLGASDYLQIAHNFHTVLIDAVPALSPANRDAARRFVTLIDTLYDNHVGLIVSAEAEPNELYPAGDGADFFKRTASRLNEMRTPGYLDRRGQRATVGD